MSLLSDLTANSDKLEEILHSRNVRTLPDPPPPSPIPRSAKRLHSFQKNTVCKTREKTHNNVGFFVSFLDSCHSCSVNMTVNTNVFYNLTSSSWVIKNHVNSRNACPLKVTVASESILSFICSDLFWYKLFYNPIL